MSVDHMRAHGTLARNIEICFELDTGSSVRQVAKRRGIKPSSVRSSAKRVRGHLVNFVAKFPSTASGQDARRKAYRAFAEHTGAHVVLARAVKKSGQQQDLF